MCCPSRYRSFNLADSSTNKSGLLGYAEPLAPAGINVTAIYKRIVNAADAQGISIEVVLGHVIDHEIGHVLLRTRSHGKGGLMYSAWDTVQYRQMGRSGMYFDPAAARLMHATVMGRGCETSVADRLRVP